MTLGAKEIHLEEGTAVDFRQWAAVDCAYYRPLEENPRAVCEY